MKSHPKSVTSLFCMQNSSVTTYPLGTRLTPTMATCPVDYGGDDSVMVSVTNQVDVDPTSAAYSSAVITSRPGAAQLPICLICTEDGTPQVQVSVVMLNMYLLHLWNNVESEPCKDSIVELVLS